MKIASNEKKIRRNLYPSFQCNHNLNYFSLRYDTMKFIKYFL